MTRYSSTMTEALQEIREGFSSKQIKMAIGIASDKRYAGGNMTGAVNAIEKIKKGLSDHPQVAAVLKRQNEENDEPASPDEGGMATDQLEFMKYAAEQMMQHIQSGGEFPEWMQNKLSGTFEKMKSLYANIEHGEMKEGVEPIQWPSQPLEEELELTEAKISKDMAIKILSMMKNQKFVKVSGDFVPEIYLSGMDRDALKKEFGRLPRGLPNASNGVAVVDFINYALGLDNEIDTEDGDKPQPKLYDYRKGKVIGKPKTVGDAAKMAGLRLEGMEHEEEEILDEWVEIDEMKMDDPKLVKHFDKLKRGDTIKLKTSSTISKGKDFVDYVVKAKNVVNKGRVEKITLVTKGNEGAVKKFLYKRDGKVTFAIGDMGASIDDIKEAAHELAEKLKVSDGVGAWIKDFQKSDAPQFQGKSEEDRKKMALAAFADAGGKLEETELDEAMSAIVRVMGKNKKLIDNELGSSHKDYKAYIIIDEDYLDRLNEFQAQLIFDYLKKHKGVAYPENDITVYFKSEKNAEGFLKDMIWFKRSFGRLDINLTALGRGIKEETELDEKAPKMKYALVGKDMKIYSMGSDERDLKLDRRSLEQRFKDVAPLKMARLKTAQSIGDKVDKSQLKEEVELDEMREPYAVVDTADGNKVVGTASDEKGAKSIISTSQLPPMKIKDKKTLKIVKVKKKQMIGQPIKEEEEPNKPDSAKEVDKMRDNKKKTRIAQLQLQIAKASETINKLNAQEK